MPVQKTNVYLKRNPQNQNQYNDTIAIMGDGKMKALFYDGPFKVSIQETDIPKIQHPDDAIIKVTTACICGSGT